MEKQRAKVTSPEEYQYLMEGQRPGSPQGRRKQKGQSRRGASQDCVPMEARGPVSFRCCGNVLGQQREDEIRTGKEAWVQQLDSSR